VTQPQQRDCRFEERKLMSKRQKSFKPGQGYTRKDWDDVQSPELTDEQMAKAKPFAEAFSDLAASIREVSDNPEWTKEDFAKAKPFAEVFPELAASIRKSGGPNKRTKKR
jgi:uncharacterized protein (DUF4415 family)